MGTVKTEQLASGIEARVMVPRLLSEEPSTEAGREGERPEGGMFSTEAVVAARHPTATQSLGRTLESLSLIPSSLNTFLSVANTTASVIFEHTLPCTSLTTSGRAPPSFLKCRVFHRGLLVRRYLERTWKRKQEEDALAREVEGR